MSEQIESPSQSPPAAAPGEGDVAEPLDLVAVVLNYRTPALTVRCLASLVTELRSLEGARVMVVENGSGDGSAELLEDAIRSNGWTDVAQLIVSPRNLGFAGGNDLGLRHAPRAKTVLALNSDAEVPEGALLRSLDVLAQDRRIGALGVRQLLADGTAEVNARRFPTPARMLLCALGLPWRFPRVFGWADIQEPDDASDPTPRDVDWLGGAFLLLPMHAIEAAGGFFDTDFFFTGEDVELCFRLRSAGYRRRYDPSIEIRHLHGGSSDPDRVSRERLQRFLWTARYLVQRKCYGRVAEWLLRTTDMLMHTVRALGGHGKPTRRREAQATLRLLRELSGPGRTA